MEIKFSFDQLCEARQQEKGQKYEYLQCSKCGYSTVDMLVDSWLESRLHDGCLLHKNIRQTGCDGILERHNQAERRNCAFDIAEELADVVNICELWLDKEDSFFWAANISALMVVAKGWGDLLLRIAKNRKDEIEVERVVPNEAGN